MAKTSLPTDPITINQDHLSIRNGRNLSSEKDRVKGSILGVCGSRTLSDERVRIILLETIDRQRPEMIVTHAEPEGVCELAQKICRELAIPVKLHFLNFAYMRGAFAIRSKRVLQDSTFCLFIHDGLSKGTSNELAMAQKMKVEYELHTLEPTKFKSSVGFEPTAWADEILTEWES